MANVNAPHGARIATTWAGIPNRVSEYQIASGYSSAIYQYDFVKLLDDGTIGVAAAGDRLLGVFQGCFYVDSEGSPKFSKHWPASTTATSIQAYVADDPREVFVVQCAGTLSGQTVVGNLADIVATTGNTSTKISKHTVSATTGTGTAQLRILRLWRSPDNAWGAYARVEVQIHEHEFAGHGAATPGV